MASLPPVNDPIIRIDSRPLHVGKREIHCVVNLKNEFVRLPHFLDYHRQLGVDRFFIIDNLSTDGSREYLLEQNDCHVFTCAGNFFRSNVEPPLWCNAVRNTYCHGHWCVSLDADELLAYPHYEHANLRRLCAYLDSRGEDALETLMLDMYAEGPVRDYSYPRGESFLKHFPFFDPELGNVEHLFGVIPPVEMVSRFRERVFWRGRFRQQRPPCITKVALVKWRLGMNYTASQHKLTAGRLSNLRGVLFHFKYFPGFFDTTQLSVESNQGVREKGLSEREAYVAEMRRNPELTLIYPGSARYESSSQLVDLGWMRTTDSYDNHVGEHQLPKAPTAVIKSGIHTIGKAKVAGKLPRR